MIDRLIKLLGPTADRDLAEFCLEDAQRIAMDYCNLQELPVELETTVIRMAADMYRMEGYGQAAATEGPVTAIREGEQSISFAADKATAIAGVGANVLKNYRARLNAFRQMRW